MVGLKKIQPFLFKIIFIYKRINNNVYLIKSSETASKY